VCNISQSTLFGIHLIIEDGVFNIITVRIHFEAKHRKEQVSPYSIILVLEYVQDTTWDDISNR
jgi:hypothetical protein